MHGKPASLLVVVADLSLSPQLLPSPIAKPFVIRVVEAFVIAILLPNHVRRRENYSSKKKARKFGRNGRVT